MSAILRALKKLEKDSAVDADIPSLPGKGKIGRIQERSVRPTTYGLIFAALILATGFAVFIRMYPAVLTSGSTEEASRPANEPVALANMAEPTSPGTNTDKPDLEKSSGNGEPSAPAPAFANPAAPGVEKSDTHGKPDPGQTEAPVSAPDRRDEENEAPEKRDKAAPSPEKQAPSGSSDSVFLEDTGLKIQAISWNETPAKRIAIINSRLFHEGERISGYRIIEINPDDIVLSDGEKTGKLIFKLH